MSSPLSRLRLAAAAFALLALALRVSAGLTWGLVPDRFGAAAQFLLEYAAPLALAVALPLGGYRLLLHRYGRPPAAFEVTAAGFVAPTSPTTGGYRAILIGFLAGGIPFTERAADGGRQLVTDSGLLLLGVTATALAVIAVWWLSALGPRIVLTPEHLETRVWRSRRFGWTAFAPGGPVPPAPDHEQLGITVTQPGGWYRTELIPHRWTHVDGTFLAGAIRHYAEHPEHRAAIGTAAELHRLRQALAMADASPIGS